MNRIQNPISLLTPQLERSLSFFISLIVHSLCLFVSGAMLVKPVEFAVESGVSSIEVRLVPMVKQPPAPVVPKPPEVVKEVPRPVVEVPKPVAKISKPIVEIPKPVMEIPEPKVEKPVVVPVFPVVNEKPKVVTPVKESVEPKKVEVIKKAEIIKEEAKQKDNRLPQVTQVASSGARTRIRPNYLKNPPPAYPQEARRQGQEGVVLLTVDVDRRGYPSMVMIKKGSGYASLDQAALKAVRRWRFAAAQIGDLKIESSVVVPIRFKLEEN